MKPYAHWECTVGRNATPSPPPPPGPRLICRIPRGGSSSIFLAQTREAIAELVYLRCMGLDTSGQKLGLGHEPGIHLFQGSACSSLDPKDGPICRQLPKANEHGKDPTCARAHPPDPGAHQQAGRHGRLEDRRHRRGCLAPRKKGSSRMSRGSKRAYKRISSCLPTN